MTDVARTPKRNMVGCEFLPAGRAWDAVKVPRSVGLTAIAILGRRSGGVIEDPRETCLYWFVAPRSAKEWAVDNTTRLTEGCYLAVPPARRTQGPGPHWRICPGNNDWITDTDVLRAAVEDALGPRLREERAG